MDASAGRLDFHQRDSDWGAPVEWSKHYFVDDECITECFGDIFPPRPADLLDLATFAYVADRLVPRRSGPRSDPFGLNWSRHFKLRVPVRDVDFWNQPAIRTSLESFLGWLTEDQWTFEFSSRSLPARPSETTARLFGSIDQPEGVALFSGGLDSLAGAERTLRDAQRPVVLVNAGTNSRMRARARGLAADLGSRTSSGCRFLSVPMKLRSVTNPDRHERSQRTRGFIFLTLGAVVANAADLSELLVFENGVGAIGLPYSEAQSGARSTRAMHPKTLALAASLLESVLGKKFTVHNDAQFVTKAQQVKSLPAGLDALIKRTVSCDTGFVHRASERPLCGECTSCLLRRQALWAGGLSRVDVEESYRFDVLGCDAGTDERAFNLEAMLIQAARLHAGLTTESSWAGLVCAFPALTQALTGLEMQGIRSDEARARLIELFETYVGEWASFPLKSVRLYLPQVARNARALELLEGGIR